MNPVYALPVGIVRTGHHAIPVELLSAHHDWLDYAAALGGLVGALAGIVALLFAVRSARDASSSAESARESLAIMRQEAQAARDERSKRAILDVRPRAPRTIGTSDNAPPRQVILTLLFRNDGTRQADRVLLNVSVPKSLDIQPCTAEGENEGHDRIEPGHQDRGNPDDKVWMHDLGTMDEPRVLVRHLRIDRPAAGRYRLRTTLIHKDIPTGKLSHHWLLIIPATGGDVRLEQID